MEIINPRCGGLDLHKGSMSNAQEVLGYAGGPAFNDFPSAKHFASWTGLCPGNSVSAGKSKSRKAKQGNPWLKGVFIEAAWGAIRTKGSYFRDLYFRKKATRGSQKAIVAVAHALLTTVFHVVRNRVPYKELGANYHKLQNRELVLKRRMRELASLGYEVAVVRDFHKPNQDSDAA